MSTMRIGGDLTKWYIHRQGPGRWLVCPPSASGRLLSDCAEPIRFHSGAQALAAFNEEDCE